MLKKWRDPGGVFFPNFVMSKIWLIFPPPKKIKRLVEFTLGKKKCPKKLRFSLCKKKRPNLQEKNQGQEPDKKGKEEETQEAKPLKQQRQNQVQCFFPFRAPHGGFYTFGCDLLFELWSFLLSSPCRVFQLDLFI